MNFKKTILLLGLMSVSLGTVAQQREIFSNPVINADVPDPSMIRVGDYYYLVSTTMHLMPGCPFARRRFHTSPARCGRGGAGYDDV